MEIPWKLLKITIEIVFLNGVASTMCMEVEKKTMKPKTKEQSEDKITKDLRNIFRLKPMKQSKTE